MKIFIRTILVLILCGAATYTVEAQSDESETGMDPAKDAGRVHFRTGVDFYRERNFRAALIEFQRAYKAYPNYKLLYNLGQASVEVQEYVQAIDYFSSYLRAGGNELDAQRRQEVERTIALLEARLASLTITSNEKGATIMVDDTAVGVVPIDKPIRVSSGRRKISATKPGMQPIEQTIDVAAGEHRSLKLDFAAPSDTTAGASKVSRSKTNWPAIIGAITTGTFAIATGALAIVTVASEKDYDKERGRETTKSILNDRRNDTKHKALATDILLGATVVSGVVTTILIFTHRDEAPSTKSPAIDVGISSNGAGLAVNGRF